MSKKNKKSAEPYQVIESFFSCASLNSHRKYVFSMLKAAYSEDYWRKSEPGALLFFQGQMEELMKATFHFSEKKNRVIRNNKAKLKNNISGKLMDPATYVGWPEQNAIWEFFPRSLSKKEFINPYLVFEKFFAFKDLNEWLALFKELINYALSKYGNDSGVDIDYLQVNNLLLKLIEASHLIQVRVNKPEQRRTREFDAQNLKGEHGIIESATAKEDNDLSDSNQVTDETDSKSGS
jgi:hypothetical protein